MASGGSNIPHNETTQMMHITAADHGPLNILPGSHYNNFRGGSYYVTSPTNDFLVLHRLYGGEASPDGQYWTVEQRKGQESYRFDFAVREHWNSLQRETSLIVPKGVYLYEGVASPQAHYLGGGWQVFIPRDVLQPLIQHQRYIIGGNQNPSAQRTALDAIKTAQENMVMKWHEQRIKVLTDQSNTFASRGSYVHRLPEEIRQAIQNGGSSSGVRLQEGTYTVHQERLPFPNGSCQTATLSVEVRFDRTTTRTYVSGNTHITETTYHYTIIYHWH